MGVGKKQYKRNYGHDSYPDLAMPIMVILFAFGLVFWMIGPFLYYPFMKPGDRFDKVAGIKKVVKIEEGYVTYIWDDSPLFKGKEHKQHWTDFLVFSTKCSK
jgi:hypothetical protein